MQELQRFITQEEVHDFRIHVLETPRDLNGSDLALYLCERYEFDLVDADIVIGAAHTVGGKAAVIINREALKKMHMSKMRVIVDISIDQGGNIYGSHPTTHKHPVYLDEFGNIRYAVSNMPGRVPAISTNLLVRATLPYVLALAEKGLKALDEVPELKSGINIIDGKLAHKEVADSLGLPYAALESVLLENKPWN